MNEIDFSKFKKFSNSSGIENNFVGVYQDKIIRIFKNDLRDYLQVTQISSKLPNLISTKLLTETQDYLAVEHEPLEFITYFNEWTRKQKVEAAIAVIELQKVLAENGYYLFDPHAFNITFNNASPVYFDFGSIKKGKVNSSNWFLKNFCGGFTKDYWDSVLKIGRIKKLSISFSLVLSQSPYELLIKKIRKYEVSKLQRIIHFLSKFFPILIRVLQPLSNKFSFLKQAVTNWSDYEQKEPGLLKDSKRVNNFIDIFNKYKPEAILDIGANKGAFSKLALSLGVKKAICADLDENSLNILRDDIRANNLSIWTAKLNLMDYDESPGCYKSYLPVHKRLHSEFCICLAVVHHLSYFGNYTFDQVAERLNRFVAKILIVEFIPHDDIHLSGPTYKGRDRSWYTTDNFIIAMKKYFPKDHQVFESDPYPRILIKFEK